MIEVTFRYQRDPPPVPGYPVVTLAKAILVLAGAVAALVVIIRFLLGA